jgi:hypothetical protein
MGCTCGWKVDPGRFFGVGRRRRRPKRSSVLVPATADRIGQVPSCSPGHRCAGRHAECEVVRDRHRREVLR